MIVSPSYASTAKVTLPYRSEAPCQGMEVRRAGPSAGGGIDADDTEFRLDKCRQRIGGLVAGLVRSRLPVTTPVAASIEVTFYPTFTVTET